MPIMTFCDLCARVDLDNLMIGHPYNIGLWNSFSSELSLIVEARMVRVLRPLYEFQVWDVYEITRGIEEHDDL